MTIEDMKKLRRAMQCRAVTEVFPVGPKNSTVCGYGAVSKHGKILWDQLTWKHVFPDRGPHALHGEASDYLHVSATIQGSPEPDDVRYRVRCRYSIGGKIGKRTVTAIKVTYYEGKWCWVITSELGATND